MSLLDKHCVPCEGGTDPLTEQRENELHSAVPEWHLNREGIHQISREFTLKNFKGALEFITQVGEIAEAEGHHPDLNLHNYKKVTVTLTTHAINGLSENDFIMAAKIDQLLKKLV
ncbi:MAG TPA: 4a-hydroxytetrahydrobiopterin dehydratase [Patescibacteria group bacterium]